MKVIANIALILVGLLIGLVFAELLTRFFMAVVPAPPGSVYIPDRVIGYRLRPDPPEILRKDPDNYVNSFGYRDHEHPVQKPEGTFRVVGIGDSFVYGDVTRLSDHFLQIAERRAQEKVDADSPAENLHVEMIMMGVGGYSPEHEVGVLRSRALPLKPDLVILNFYVGNDVTAIPIRGKVLRGRLYFAGSPYPTLALLRHSYLFLMMEGSFLPQLRGTLLRWYLKYLMKQQPQPEKPAPRPGAVGDSAAARIEVSQWHLHVERKDLPVYLSVPDERMRKLWSQAEGYLDEFDRLCRAAGVPWILHLIPADLQVDPELRKVVLDDLGLPAERYDFDLPQRRLWAFAAAHRVPVADPLEALRRGQSSGTRFYRANDIHWNNRGHELAGKALGDLITEEVQTARGIIPVVQPVRSGSR